MCSSIMKHRSSLTGSIATFVGPLLGLVTGYTATANLKAVAHTNNMRPRHMRPRPTSGTKAPQRQIAPRTKLAQTQFILVGQQAQIQQKIAALPNDTYQFCSKPEPQDWSLGAGICFWFQKKETKVVGYYGYPHSDHFVDCISGDVTENQISGQAVAIAWPGSPWQNIPASPFSWDKEGYLSLGQSEFVPVSNPEIDNVEIVHFSTATLVLEGFYRYSDTKVDQMKPPPQTCEAQHLFQ